MGLKSTKEIIEVDEALLIGFELNRTLYYSIILVITIIALLGNLLVIKTIIFRKFKYLQKTCIISLAVSDILTVILFAMSNLNMLHEKLTIWIYGEFLCHYLPVGQVWNNLIGSVALLVIALDRYHNVIYALSVKWNPALWKCLIGAFTLWIICGALSYPVATFYIYIPILVNGEETAMCSGDPLIKSKILLYYICMNCLFFIPIVVMFFWFYYKIAFLIWRHRKPPQQEASVDFQQQEHQQEITDTSGAFSTQFTSGNNSQNVIRNRKKRNIQMKKKIRTFKVVVALIVAFIGCRFPYWMHMVYQQTGKTADRNVMWNIRFATTALYLLNCALNPFLYTFLNVTIMICKMISKFFSHVCCCCFSNSEFEDFETGNYHDKIAPASNVMMMRVERKSAKETYLRKNNVSEKKTEIHFIDVPLPKYTENKEIF